MMLLLLCLTLTPPDTLMLIHRGDTLVWVLPETRVYRSDIDPTPYNPHWLPDRPPPDALPPVWVRWNDSLWVAPLLEPFRPYLPPDHFRQLLQLFRQIRCR